MTAPDVVPAWPLEQPEPPAMSRLVKALEDGFSTIRRRHPELPPFVVVVATGSEGRAGLTHWGHFMARRWARRIRIESVDTSTRRPVVEQFSEIKISAEGLGRPVMETWETMLHECAHALAEARGVRDTSDAGRYHNERFLALAIELGLAPPAERHPRHGWAMTMPDEPVMRARYGSAIAELEAALDMYRREDRAATPAQREGGGGRRVAAVCGCDRRISVVPSVLELGPIECGICKAPFVGPDTEDPRDDCEECAESGDECSEHGSKGAEE